MKNRIFILSLLMALLLGVSWNKEVLAAEYESETVFDMADLLTENEEASLEKMAKKYERYDVSIIFMTTDNAEGKTTQNYSNDFYDSHNFRPDGVMFSIDMDNREIYIDTVGRCIEMITDDMVDSALEVSYSYATDGEYEACLSLMGDIICSTIEECENPLLAAVKPSFFTIVVMLVAAVVVVIVLLVKHYKDNSTVAAEHYMGNDFSVKNINTVFMGVRKEVLKDYYAEPKESSSGGSGGGSSSHTSSSGVSHGGGGHKF